MAIYLYQVKFKYLEYTKAVYSGILYISIFLEMISVDEINYRCLFVFVCLYGGFSPSREYFTQLETSPLTMRGNKFWPIYTRNSWPLIISSDGSFTCQTYCDTGQPFIGVVSEDPWHSYLLPSVWQWSCHCLYLRLRSVEAGIRPPNLLHARRTL